MRQIPLAFAFMSLAVSGALVSACGDTKKISSEKSPVVLEDEKKNVPVKTTPIDRKDIKNSENNTTYSVNYSEGPPPQRDRIGKLFISLEGSQVHKTVTISTLFKDISQYCPGDTGLSGVLVTANFVGHCHRGVAIKYSNEEYNNNREIYEMSSKSLYWEMWPFVSDKSLYKYVMAWCSRKEANSNEFNYYQKEAIELPKFYHSIFDKCRRLSVGYDKNKIFGTCGGKKFESAIDGNISESKPVIIKDCDAVISSLNPPTVKVTDLQNVVHSIRMIRAHD